MRRPAKAGAAAGAASELSKALVTRSVAVAVIRYCYHSLKDRDIACLPHIPIGGQGRIGLRTICTIHLLHTIVNHGFPNWEFPRSICPERYLNCTSQGSALRGDR
jgi:hypothetical protein